MEKTAGNYEYFQNHAFDSFFGKVNSANRVQSIGVMYDTTPLGSTLTEYFASRYAHLYKLVPRD